MQIYASRPNSNIKRPSKELKGFQRVSLQAGETKAVKMQIPIEKLRYWDEAANGWKVEPGIVVVQVGSSSQDIRLSQATEI
ncbi:MAG: fibronectin type III-like domain-contianing protein [Bacteroides sp.]|nr:fibronectin type III-like domain-contianing protein [Bacteroides sp.]